MAIFDVIGYHDECDFHSDIEAVRVCSLQRYPTAQAILLVTKGAAIS